MSMYRYRIAPLTGFASPLQSDTLHGHLLWALRERDGDQAVQDHIASFENGSCPFICSSAVPRGMLPMPVLPPIARERFVSLANEVRQSSLFEALGNYKRFRKLSWVPVSVWKELQGGMNQERLFKAWLLDQDLPEPSRSFASPFKTRTAVQPHNTIDRASGRVLQGGLFFPEVHFHDRNAELDIYVKTSLREDFERLLEHVSLCGFGADSSTGKGHFSWQLDQEFAPDLFAGEGNHHMTLSVLSAQSLAAVQGYYKTFTKYGKVWNGYGERNPFKKPFLAFAEGSVFSSLPEGGPVLRNIHADPKVVQIVAALTLPLTLSQT